MFQLLASNFSRRRNHPAGPTLQHVKLEASFGPLLRVKLFRAGTKRHVPGSWVSSDLICNEIISILSVGLLLRASLHRPPCPLHQ